MNIVVVNDFGYVNGGTAKVAIDSAIGLRRCGHRVIYFTAVEPIDESLTNSGVEVVNIYGKEFLHYDNRLMGAAYGLWNFEAKNKLENLLESLDKRRTVVHVHGWIKALSASVFSAVSKYDFPMVITAHDYLLACPNGVFFDYQEKKICHCQPLSMRCFLSNCDKRNYLQKLYRLVRSKIQGTVLSRCVYEVICVSEFSKNILKENLCDLGRGYVVRNPVIDGPVTGEYTVPLEKRKWYIYIGRIDPEKGADLFCQAVTECNVYGVVIGSGGDLEELQRLYADNHRLVFAGWQEQEAWGKWLCESKAVVFPSRFYETFLLTVLEVQSRFRIPAVVPDECAGSEWIMDGYNGLIFRTGDLDDLKKKIMQIENGNVKFWHENVRGGLSIADLDTANHVKKLVNVYRDIL